MQYRSRRERAAGRAKLLAILAVLVVIGILVWFWSMGGEQPVTTITEPVTPAQPAG
ncbi:MULTISPECIES: hypothetical protein [Novosphingopyxis]|uniref:hypothetical protein n=1 Tax=Novosphingopyxis TaxID=2709686 RepID=UPI001650F090|nr:MULTISPECIES: hypothetical protein [Novosphingopyxis]MBH9537661.1 hypothetical protein [Novosphingopyxis sp. YJ-S2-01]|tara:strand:- start:380 stop:547 length:168 start_codon:yes stop_codon:yes gene_type:complete